MSQALDWAGETQQYPGKIKSFSAWSLEWSRGDRQVTGKVRRAMTGRCRGLRVQGKGPDQGGIGFLHLARSGSGREDFQA